MPGRTPPFYYVPRKPESSVKHRRDNCGSPDGNVEVRCAVGVIHTQWSREIPQRHHSAGEPEADRQEQKQRNKHVHALLPAEQHQGDDRTHPHAEKYRNHRV